MDDQLNVVLRKLRMLRANLQWMFVAHGMDEGAVEASILPNLTGSVK